MSLYTLLLFLSNVLEGHYREKRHNLSYPVTFQYKQIKNLLGKQGRWLKNSQLVLQKFETMSHAGANHHLTIHLHV